MTTLSTTAVKVANTEKGDPLDYKWLEIHASAIENTEGNYSDVYAYMIMDGNGTANTQVLEAYLEINGTQVGYRSGSWTYSSGAVIVEGTVRVSHNSDGTKSITIKGHFSGRFKSGGTSDLSATVSLATIPRQTVPSIPNPLTSGQSNRITTKRNNSTYKHRFTWGFGSLTGQFPTDTWSTSTTYYSADYFDWTISDDMIDEMPSTQSVGKGWMRCYTYNSSNVLVGIDEQFIYIQPGFGPTIEKNSDGYLDSYSETALGGDGTSLSSKIGNNAILKGVSGRTATVKATTSHGATLTSLSITCGDVSQTLTDVKSGTEYTLTISGLQNGTVTITATDSRSKTDTITYSGTVYDYSKPALKSFDAVRASDLADYVEKNSAVITGVFFNGVIGDVTNNVKVNFTNITNGNEEYDTNVTLYNNTFTANPTKNITNVVYNQNYMFQVTVTDSLGFSDQIIGYLSRSTPVIWFGKDTVKVYDYLIANGAIYAPQVYVGESGFDSKRDILTYFRTVSGSTWTLGEGTAATRFEFAGVLTGSNKEIYFTVPLRHTVSSKPSVTALKANIRAYTTTSTTSGLYIVGTSGGYVEGGVDLMDSSNDKVDVQSYSQNMVTIKIKSGDAANYGGLNNMPVNVEVNLLTLKFA